ncbi:MAG: xanthine dehydrogenase family protein [Chloroflexi bacterium]|nr:xanthine dehydrogenase family protein [Chloroflexota bacterium]
MTEHSGHEMATGIGSPLRRKETERFVLGAGTYTDDVLLANQAYVAFVRSFHAHAAIRGFDLDAARTVPGVLGIFTSEDWSSVLGVGAQVGRHERQAEGGREGTPRSPMASGIVHSVGEIVAVVVAESRYQAQDAASAVGVQYEELPVVLDPEAAMQPDAPLVFEDRPNNIMVEIHFDVSDGKSADETFLEADQVASARLKTQRIHALAMEPRAVVASYDHVADEVTVWLSSNGVFGLRSQLAGVMGLSETKVRVINPDVGGSFGGKNGIYPEEIILPVLARYLRRPVKWAEMRTEHLAVMRNGRDQTHYVELALRADGRVLAMRDRMIADLGANTGPNVSMTAASLYLTGPYDIQTYKVDAYAVATTKNSHGSVRGIGKADASFVMERTMNIAARQLGIDPTEIRFKNFVPEEKFPYRTATGAMLDSGRYAECLRKAMELADYERLRREQPELNERLTVKRGIGVSFAIEPTGAARRGQGGGYGACRLKMELSGVISAYPAGAQQGQGHITTVSQIVADRMGGSPDNVHVFEPDTLVTPVGAGAGSSRTSQTVMPAVLVAANQLRDKILRIAGHRLGVSPETLRLEGDVVRGAQRQITLREIIQIAYQDVDRLPPGEDPALEVTGYFINTNHVYDRDELGRRNEFSSYPYEAVIAVVDVDTETGVVEIVKYVSVHDCGNMINPRIVTTQHMGSIAQGLGTALYEEVLYDEDGKLLTGTFMDYLLPTAQEIPPLVLGHTVTPTPFTPLGAKGAGETGTISAPCALGNAIEDAFGGAIEVRYPPYTPERVLKAIQRSQAVATGGASRG